MCNVFECHFKQNQKNHSDMGDSVYEEFIFIHNLDGTNGNTGLNHGAVKYIEMELGRELQWLVCIFHMLESPFK